MISNAHVISLQLILRVWSITTATGIQSCVKLELAVTITFKMIVMLHHPAHGMSQNVKLLPNAPITTSMIHMIVTKSEMMHYNNNANLQLKGIHVSTSNTLHVGRLQRTVQDFLTFGQYAIGRQGVAYL